MYRLCTGDVAKQKLVREERKGRRGRREEGRGKREEEGESESWRTFPFFTISKFGLKDLCKSVPQIRWRVDTSSRFELEQSPLFESLLLRWPLRLSTKLVPFFSVGHCSGGSLKIYLECPDERRE